MQLTEKQQSRIFGSVETNAGGCWLSHNDRMANGYARFSIDGKKRLAHRIVYEHFHGPIPDGMVVMHSCDTRNCINPAHLSVGTPRDNTMDMHSKGRGWKGNGSPSAREYRPRKAGPPKKPRLKTHCSHGHAMVEGNIYVRATGQICLTCKREREAKIARKMREQHREAKAKVFQLNPDPQTQQQAA